MPSREMKTLDVRTRAKWRKWLEKHHDSATEIWLVFHKQHTGVSCVSYDDAVEEAYRNMASKQIGLQNAKEALHQHRVSRWLRVPAIPVGVDGPWPPLTNKPSESSGRRCSCR